MPNIPSIYFPYFFLSIHQSNDLLISIWFFDFSFPSCQRYRNVNLAWGRAFLFCFVWVSILAVCLFYFLFVFIVCLLCFVFVFVVVFSLVILPDINRIKMTRSQISDLFFSSFILKSRQTPCVKPEDQRVNKGEII